MENLRINRGSGWLYSIGGAVVLIIMMVILLPLFGYFMCRIEVPSKHIAILIKKTGKDLSNDQELAPSEEYKGLQKQVLSEGRHFRNPWIWGWEIVQQVDIPQEKLGVRIRLYGDDLPYAQIIASQDSEKGIVPDVLRAGRYPINGWVKGTPRRRSENFAEIIELHSPIVIPAGYKGVVTNLSGPMPADSNQLLVEEGTRGVQEEPLAPGTYYVNPYVTRVNLVDCRSQRFNLSSDGEMGFPSKDGFWVTLDGIIEFRIKPEMSSTVFVTYNDVSNDTEAGAQVDEEIINKVILPNARSFCRLRGSDHSGKEFISGETRTKFQQDFQDELATTCESQGIQIIQALITRINPPQKIALPVRERQIAIQEETQYQRQMEQQKSEEELAIQQELVKQKQALIEAEREVVKVVTEATKKQEVALIEAKQRLNVAQFELQAAEDLAAAITARGAADAKVIEFNNLAEAAGWKKSVEAFSGDGNEYARWVMLKKLAPAYRQMMVNTADSPLMDIFQQYNHVEPTPSLAKTPSSAQAKTNQIAKDVENTDSTDVPE